MDKNKLAKEIKKVAYVTGNFKLRSGKTSNFYWDKYRFESNPLLLDEITNHLIKLLPKSFDKLAGLELGGIPLASILSVKLRKPCLFVRKEAKKYGTCNLIEGKFKKKDKVVVVEDIITTAGQVCSSIKNLRNAGLKVSNIVCVIDREQGGKGNLKKLGCTLSSVFTSEDLE